MNHAEYLKLFSDTSSHAKQYIFIPNPTSSARYSFSSWDKNIEDEYFNKIIASVGKSTLLGFTILAGPQIEPSPPDSAKYSFEYSLFVPHQRTDITTQFVGTCDIFMSKDKYSVWKIYRWIDRETKKDSSWSELKGYFAKGN